MLFHFKTFKAGHSIGLLLMGVVFRHDVLFPDLCAAGDPWLSGSHRTEWEAREARRPRQTSKRMVCMSRVVSLWPSIMSKLKGFGFMLSLL